VCRFRVFASPDVTPATKSAGSEERKRDSVEYDEIPEPLVNLNTPTATATEPAGSEVTQFTENAAYQATSE